MKVLIPRPAWGVRLFCLYFPLLISAQETAQTISSEDPHTFQWHSSLIIIGFMSCLLLSTILFAFNQRRIRKKQKIAVKKLKDLERKLSTLLFNLPGLAYRCHNDGGDWVMEYISAGALELTGYHPEELIGRKGLVFGDLIHPEDSPYIDKQVTGASELGKRFRLQYRIRHVDGSYRWVWEQGILVEGGKDGGMLEGFICDISEQKCLEEEKDQSVDKVQKVLKEMKVLQGIIPICSCCKKIRDDGGSWQQMEAYIKDHSEADFSHGICPVCIQELYPEFADTAIEEHSDDESPPSLDSPEKG